MSADTSLLVLLVRAGETLIGLPITGVAETLRPLPCTRVPNVPSFVAGASVIRGVTTPVLDLGALLGATAGQELRRIVTVRVRDRLVALAVRAVLGLRRIDVTAFQALPPMLAPSGDKIAALQALDGELFVLLDTGRTVTDEVLEACKA